MKQQKIDYLVHNIMSFMPEVRKSFAPPIHECGGKRLAPHQFFCLSILDKQGAINMGTLAFRLGVSNQQLTRIVGDLEKEDLAERVTDPDNRRAVLVRLTQTGVETVKEAESRKLAKTSSALNKLTEKELDALIFHFKGLTEILTKLL